MKKRKLLNICMVVTILITVICGIMAVGSVKGWFDSKEEQTAEYAYTISEKTGIAMIERSGVAYEVEQGTRIRPEDHLYTKNGATLTLANAEKNGVYLNSNSEAVIAETQEVLSFEVAQGEALVDARGWNGIHVVSNGTTITLDGAAASISTQTGSTMVYVYAGEITLLADGEKEATIIKAGNVVTILGNGEAPVTESLKVNSLNDIQIAQIIKCGIDETFCFTQEDLIKVQEDREAEIQKAQEEAIKLQEEAKKKAEEEKEEKTEKTDKTDKSKKTEEKSDSTENKTTTNTTGNKENSGTTKPESTTPTTEPEKNESENETTDSSAKTCTMKIVCDTILNNMGNLTTGKEAYVPANGVILGTTTVEFSEGETVFDVLKRVCSSVNIQLEYSYTPMYESYYIEGINYLYEFDCGSESGWMYKVNGWFPNYGCSSYTLQEGDTIVWCYTCNGLGADVGA